jgi:hypothetical protein
VLEEATNPEGTLFVLLEGVPLGKSHTDIEEAAATFLPELILEVAVIVYPATSPRGAAETHEATTVRMQGSGAPVASTLGWSDLVSASGVAGSSTLSTEGLVYRHGSSTFLITRQPEIDAAQEPPAPVPAVAMLSPLGVFLEERLEAVVLEEATNDHGTVFALLGLLPMTATVASVEETVHDFLASWGGGTVVIVYPRTRNHHMVGTHEATSATMLPSGRVQIRSNEWGAILVDAFASLSGRALTNQGLTFTWGASRFLAAIPDTAAPDYRPPRSPTQLARYTPHTSCTSSTTSYGNSMSCYTNGRLTYRSVCTIDSRYNVTCRSDSY